MKKTLISIAFLLWAALLSAQPVNEFYFRLKFEDKKELKELTTLISIDDVKGNTLKAYATSRQLKKLKKAGYSPSMLTRPSLLQTKDIDMASSVAEMANWDKYPTYEVYEEMMVNFTQDYPNLCRLDTIGTTVENRHLLVLKITDQPDMEEEEPEFFYTSTMHGDETTGFVLMIRLIDYLLSNYGTDAQVTNLIDQAALFVNPNANPDGTYTNDNSTVSGATRSNANYVDLNRNFPDPDDGPHPDGNDWQPETEAMMAFAQNHNITMAANFHGGAEVANYPWDTWQRMHTDHAWLEKVSYLYANNAMEDGPSGYFTSVSSDGVTNGYAWYPIAGGRQDFMTYMMNAREITMEVSDVKLLASEELPDHWNYNKDAMLLYMEEVLNGFHGTVKNTAGDPLSAEIYALNHDATQDSSMVFTDPDAGDFHRLLADGTYTFVAESEGYIPDTVENITIADNQVMHHFVLEQASPVTLTGTVTKANTGGPVEGAEVYATDTEANPVTTNAEGNYSLPLWEGNFSVQVSKTGYTLVSKSIALTAGNNQLDFSLPGEIRENFESGNLQSFAWESTGGSDWFVTSQQAYEGSHSAKSGNISDNMHSTLQITTSVLSSGNISFYRKVSSESGYDYLNFYIDGNKAASWSGEGDWEKFSFPVESGTHTFTWEYQKDGYVSEGEDCAWVDEVVFPHIDVSEPELQLTPDTLALEADVNTMVNATLTIGNTGGLPLNYTAEVLDAASHEWLSLQNPEGTVSAGSTSDLSISMQTPETPQTLQAEIRIAHNASGGDTLVPVTLNVKYHPVFTYTPQTIEHALYLNQRDTMPVYVSNEGSGSINYSWYKETGASNNWLKLQGTPTNLTGQTDTLHAICSTVNLPTGNYETYIVFDNETQDQRDTLPVHLQVRERPYISIQPDSISEVLAVETNKEISFKLRNTGGSVMHYELAIPNAASAWFSASPTGESIDAGSEQDVQGSINAPADDTLLNTQLEIRVTETDSSIQIPVHVQVYSEPDFQYSPDSMHFTMTAGETAPADTLCIKNAGTGIIPYSLALDFGTGPLWAALAETSGEVKDETDSVQVNVLSADLPAGTYNGNILLTNNDQGKTDTIPIHLEIWEKPALIPEKDSIKVSLHANEEASRAIEIAKTGQQPISYTTAIANPDASWLSLHADAGIVKNQQTDTLRFHFQPGDLAPATYTSQIFIENQLTPRDTVFVKMVVLNPSGLTTQPQSAVHVYPQPFAHKLHIELPSKAQAIIRITDLRGRRHRQFSISGSHVILRKWNALPAGIYVIQIHQNGSFYRQLIEKQ